MKSRTNKSRKRRTRKKIFKGGDPMIINIFPKDLINTIIQDKVSTDNSEVVEVLPVIESLNSEIYDATLKDVTDIPEIIIPPISEPPFSEQPSLEQPFSEQPSLEQPFSEQPFSETTTIGGVISLPPTPTFVN